MADEELEFPEKPSTGRPPKLTPQRRQDLLKWLRAGMPLYLASKLAGVNESTVRLWRSYSRKGRKGYKTFDTDVEQAMAEGESVNVARIIAAGAKNWRAAAWLLERSQPDKWGPPQPSPVPDAPPPDLSQSARADDQTGL